MVRKNKEIIFTKLADDQLMAAKQNSLLMRGNNKGQTKKYFQAVLKDIKAFANGNNIAKINHDYSDIFARAKVAKHNVFVFETKSKIYIVGFIHPEQDARKLLVDQEKSLQALGKSKFVQRLERLSL